MSAPKTNHIKIALDKARKIRQAAVSEPAAFETGGSSPGQTEAAKPPPLAPPPPLKPPEALKPLRLNPGRLKAGDLFQNPAAAKEFNRLSDWLLKAVEASSQPGLTLAGISPGAGSSTLAWSLALSWARARPERRIMLIEANWRSPGLERIAGLPQGPGLSDYLAGRIDLGDFLGEVGLERLMLAGAGQWQDLGPLALGSSRVRNLMYGLKRLYPGQLTILDAPALTSPEALALLRPSDNLLVVANQAAVLKDDFRFVAGLLKRQRLPVLGVVMNRSRGFF